MFRREPNSTGENVAATGVRAEPSAEAACAELRASARVMRLPVPSQEICERVRLAVIEAAKRDAESMQLLQQSVCDFTTALQHEGATPEAVLISLKAVLSAGGGRAIEYSVSDTSAYLLREKMSTWCIEHYFSDTSGGVTPADGNPRQ